MSEFNFYAGQIIDGIAFGSIYGIFALSIVMLYRANKLFNLAQTEIATLCAVIAVLLMRKFSFWTAVGLTLAISFLIGFLLHLLVMRFITERKKVSHATETAATIAFFTIFNSLSNYILGDEPQPFSSPFGSNTLNVLGVDVSYLSVGIILTTLVLALIIRISFKFTKLGLIMEAVGENIAAARMRGIRASNILALAWALTVATSALGAILIAPVLTVTPTMLLSIFAYALIAVVIGGLESPLGALVGGIIIGVVENLASTVKFIGSDLKFVAVAFTLIAILLVRPRGLWGRAEARRV
jgi:branched-chain amino acid transport system permease protein